MIHSLVEIAFYRENARLHQRLGTVIEKNGNRRVPKDDSRNVGASPPQHDNNEARCANAPGLIHFPKTLRGLRYFFFPRALAGLLMAGDFSLTASSWARISAAANWAWLIREPTIIWSCCQGAIAGP